MKVFGPQGPIEDFADALDRALQSKKRVLKVKVERDGKRKPVELRLPKKVDPYGKSFPFDCDRTEEVLEGLYEYLVENAAERLLRQPGPRHVRPSRCCPAVSASTARPSSATSGTTPRTPPARTPRAS